MAMESTFDLYPAERQQQILTLLNQIQECGARSRSIEEERSKIYGEQGQIRENMKALSSTGKEGEVRAAYVQRLQASEQKLEGLVQQEQALKNEVEALNRQLDQRL